MANPRICSIPECNKPEQAGGCCSMHYWRMRKYGTTELVKIAGRKVRLEGHLAFIPLTRGYEAVIDVEDVALVEGRFWRVVPNHSGINYVVASLPGHKRLALHRHLLNPPETMVVDHINGDALDNRRSNLRIASQSQNCMNKKRRVSGSSRFKGVSWVSRTKKWQATIRAEGRDMYLGQFDIETDAYASYCEAAIRYYGEYARLT